MDFSVALKTSRDPLFEELVVASAAGPTGASAKGFETQPVSTATVKELMRTEFGNFMVKHPFYPTYI
jgi:hypothetical protein